jgi:hypothetical protein
VEDLDYLFADPLISVPVIYGTTHSRGILDAADQFLSTGIVSSTGYTLLVPAQPFLNVESGDTINIDGTDYVANFFSRVDDGKVARIGVSKV